MKAAFQPQTLGKQDGLTCEMRGREEKLEKELLFVEMDGRGDGSLFGLRFLRSGVIVYSSLK